MKECQMLGTRDTGKGKCMWGPLATLLPDTNVPKAETYFHNSSVQRASITATIETPTSSNSPEYHVQSIIHFGKSNYLMNSLAAGLVISITGKMNLIKFGASSILRWGGGGEPESEWFLTMMDGLLGSKIKWSVMIGVAHKDGCYLRKLRFACNQTSIPMSWVITHILL